MFLTYEDVERYRRARIDRQKQISAVVNASRQQKIHKAPRGISMPRWRAMLRSYQVRGIVP